KPIKKPIKKPINKLIKKPVFKIAKNAKRNIRFLRSNQSIRIIGKTGNEVKRARSDRDYVIQVVEGKKIVGYINSTTKTKSRKPIPSKFSSSMIARLKHARTMTLTKASTRHKKIYVLNNKKRLSTQISRNILQIVKRNKGKAFSLKIKPSKHTWKEPANTPYVYNDGKISDKYLKNIIVSGILMRMRQARFTMTPKLIAQGDLKKGWVREESIEVQLSFADVPKVKKSKRKKKK
ncbi:hypothetical protein C5B42_04470, partial [Candidatus Cerribacteria bacterium 'Amazon FNV 2010 28 9']